MNSKKELCIVLPVHNEGERLIVNIDSLSAILNQKKIEYEIICVDDCSTNNTYDLLIEYSYKNENIRVIQNKINEGKGKTVKNGINLASARFVIFTDADLAYDEESMLNVYYTLKSEIAGFVCANRRDPKTKFLIDREMFKYVYKRYQLSGVFNAFVRLLFGLETKDTQSGLKGFTLDSAQKIFNNLSIYNFAFDVEIFILAKKYNISNAFVPCVVRYPHEPSTVKIIGDSFGMFLTLLKLKLRYLRNSV